MEETQEFQYDEEDQEGQSLHVLVAKKVSHHIYPYQQTSDGYKQI